MHWLLDVRFSEDKTRVWDMNVQKTLDLSTNPKKADKVKGDGYEKKDNEARIKELKENEYQMLLGVDKRTFGKMYEILIDEYNKLHEKGGKPPKLTVLDKLVITLGYWREDRAYRNIAFDYGVGKSAIGNAIIWVENTLIKDKTFSLPSKRVMQHRENTICVAVVDVTEHEIERPKKDKKNGIQARKNVIP